MPAHPSDDWNGISKETDVDLPDGVVYCTVCGTIFVSDKYRDCPSCTLAETMERELGGEEIWE